jgi:hypothetical protein
LRFEGFSETVKSFLKETAREITAHVCIGTCTGTVLATSTHANSLDPRARLWQE